MSNVSQERFLEWKDNPVTQAVMEVVKYRIEDTKEKLTGLNDRDYDIYLKGMIRGFQEMLEVTIEETI